MVRDATRQSTGRECAVTEHEARTDRLAATQVPLRTDTGYGRASMPGYRRAGSSPIGLRSERSSFNTITAQRGQGGST